MAARLWGIWLFCVVLGGCRSTDEPAPAAQATPSLTAPAEAPTIPPAVVPAMIGGVEIQPAHPKRGDTLQAVVTTAPGFTLRYRWEVNGRELGLTTSESWSGELRRGDRVRVVVVPYKAGVEGIAMASDPVIVINSPPVYAGSMGEGFQLNGHTFQVQDPDGDALRFSIQGAPPGMTLDPDTGKLSWQAPAAPGAEGQVWPVTVVAADPAGDEVKISFEVKTVGG